MKTLRKLRLPHLFAVVAAAGLSISAAYAVPSYSPDINSPINTPDSLPDLGAGLTAISSFLPSGTTLVLPAVNAAAVKPLKNDFLAAVVSAVAGAASDAEKASIVRSALSIGANPAYGYSVTKDVVRLVMKDYLGSTSYSQAGAIQIMNAALAVNNGKTNDVVGGLVLAIGDVGAASQEQDTDELAAAAFGTMSALSQDTATKAGALVEKLADAMIKNMKPNSTGTLGYSTTDLAARVADTAVSLVDAVEASNAKFLIDDVVRGIATGSKTLISSGVSFPTLVTAVANAVSPDPESQAHAFAGFARNTKGFEPTNATLTGIDDVKAAFKAGSSLADDAVEALSDGYFTMGNTPPASRATALSALIATADGAPVSGIPQVQGNASNAANLQFVAAGAAYFSAGTSGLVVSDLIPLAATPSAKAEIVAAVSRAANGGAAKAAGAAVASPAGITPAAALSAALPNTLASFSGAVAKEVTKAAAAATTSELVTATINALMAAAAARPENNHKEGIIDAISEIGKIRKTGYNDIINASVLALPASSGYLEAVMAAVGRNENKVDHTLTIESALMSAGATSEQIASAKTAERVARLAKTNSKSSLSIAQQEMRESGASLHAVLLGGGSINKAFVNVLLASALREGAGSLSSGDKQLLLAHAKSLSKTLEADVQLAYDVANQVLTDKDGLFDIVDKNSLVNSKSVATVATAAAAAAPEYAHYVARAAAYRSSASTIAKVPLAVMQGADMNSNAADNPAATAAIAAGFVHGIMDAKHASTVQPKVLAAGVTAMIKAAMLMGDKGVLATASTAASGSFRSVDINTGAAPSDANQPEYGSAAATTGVTAILTAPGDVLPNDNLIAALKAVGKAVGKGTRSQMTVVAQAAAQAFYFVTNAASPAAIQAIANAVSQGAFNNTAAADSRILLAAQNGVAEAVLGNYGAGAAGILNYAHFNVNNSPVTDISGF